MINRLFSRGQYKTEDDKFRGGFINGFAWIVILLLSVAILPNLGPSADANAGSTIIVLSSLIIVMFLSLYFLRLGKINISGSIIVVFSWIGLGVQAFTADGVRDVIIIAYIAVSLLASIIINWRMGAIVMFLSIGVIWTLALLEVNGYLHPRFQEPIAFSRDLSIVFISVAVLIYLSTITLREAITRATDSEQNLLATNESLQNLNQTLEERVRERTAELDNANRNNIQRAQQFEAIAQVVRAISSIQDLDTLLPRITQVICEQFATYHSGIFLLDTPREFAVLRAANSEGGKRMLAREHKLLVGQTGLVGFVTASGQPRIALDVGTDAIFFDNPDLPETRSEITLPLRYGGQIIGALDVQSKVENAFGQNDVEVLITLADQVAVAINNTTILEEARKALVESQDRFSQATLESWKVLRPKSLGFGFELLDFSIKPLNKPIEGDLLQKAIVEEKTILSNQNNKTSNLTLPIRLRGKVIGVMSLRSRNNYILTEDDADIAEAVSERLTLALESAMLIQSTQQRADIERVTSDISSKISSSTHFDTILQTAAQELSKALGGSDVLVQIEPASMALGMNK